MIRTCSKIRYRSATTAAAGAAFFPRFPRTAVRTTLRSNSNTAATTTSKGSQENNGDLPNEKINKLVESISQLSLLETSELIKALQKKLNLPESNGMMTMMNPMMMQGQAAGNVATDGGAANGDGGSGSTAAEEEEKATFTVKLTSFDTKSKAKVIKEIKSLLGLSLVDAKKFVEAAPRVVKEHLSKEESDALKTKLESLGAKIELD